MLKKILSLLAIPGVRVQLVNEVAVRTAEATGEPCNFVAQLSWTEGHMKCGTSLTEGGLAEAKFNAATQSLEVPDYEGEVVKVQLVADGKVLNLTESQPADEPTFLVIQEGGSSTELYLHAHDSRAAADDDRVSCAEDGSYRTSEVIEVPASLAAHPQFFEFAEKLLRGTLTITYPEEA